MPSLLSATLRWRCTQPLSDAAERQQQRQRRERVAPRSSHGVSSCSQPLPSAASPSRTAPAVAGSAQPEDSSAPPHRQGSALPAQRVQRPPIRCHVPSPQWRTSRPPPPARFQPPAPHPLRPVAVSVTVLSPASNPHSHSPSDPYASSLVRVRTLVLSPLSRLYLHLAPNFPRRPSSRYSREGFRHARHPASAQLPLRPPRNPREAAHFPDLLHFRFPPFRPLTPHPHAFVVKPSIKRKSGRKRKWIAHDCRPLQGCATCRMEPGFAPAFRKRKQTDLRDAQHHRVCMLAAPCRPVIP